MNSVKMLTLNTMRIYIINKTILDPSENEYDSAIKFKPVGFVLSRKKAIRICSNSRQLTKNDCWALSNMVYINEYNYEVISYFNETQR
jgi:hypothetical protein